MNQKTKPVTVSADTAFKIGETTQTHAREIKHLSGEDIVLIFTTLTGFLGGALLFMLNFPPILIAVFLSTGISTLVYRFLGGIESTSVNIGALKLSGSLAALVGCALFLNTQLVDQTTTRPNNGPLSLTQEGNEFRVLYLEESLGLLDEADIKALGFYSELSKNVEQFIVTERLPANSQIVNLDPLPFRLKTKFFGGEYTRFVLTNDSGDELYRGSIYRRQAEIITIGDQFYFASVVEVDHTGTLSEQPYAKFAFGKLNLL